MRGVSNLALVLPPLVLLVEVVVAWLLATAEVVKMKISYPQDLTTQMLEYAAATRSLRQ